MNKKQIMDEIFKRKAVAVLRVKEEDKLKKVIQTSAESGVSITEITMTVPNAIFQIYFSTYAAF